jgi:hypothetical protein
MSKAFVVVTHSGLLRQSIYLQKVEFYGTGYWYLIKCQRFASEKRRGATTLSITTLLLKTLSISSLRLVILSKQHSAY